MCCRHSNCLVKHFQRRGGEVRRMQHSSSAEPRCGLLTWTCTCVCKVAEYHLSSPTVQDGLLSGYG